jgi:hypothetical protein
MKTKLLLPHMAILKAEGHRFDPGTLHSSRIGLLEPIISNSVSASRADQPECAL